MSQNDLDKWADILKFVDNPVLYEAGVAAGGNLLAILETLKNQGRYAWEINLFDSFVGLPDEVEGVPKHESWTRGAFNIVDEIRRNNSYEEKTDNVGVAVRFLREKIEKYDWPYNFIVGFFDELTDEFAKDMTPATLIHVDADLYISTYQFLDWVFRNELLEDRAVISFDDWFIPGLAEYEGGESRAFKEILEKYPSFVFEEVRRDANTKTFRRI